MDRREFIARSGLTAAAIALNTSALAASPSDEELLAHVHPDLREILRAYLPVIKSTKPLSASTLAAARQPSALTSKPLSTVPYEKRTIPGRAGQPSVDVFVINAGKVGRRPAILHTHGGGFVVGRALDAVADLQEICRQLDCVAVTVDYRLAPETTYAGSLEDNYAGLKWLHDNSDQLGVDSARIAVMGESAGGGHAALLAIAARDRGEVRLAFQCLTYPMLDDRTGSSRSVPEHVGRIGWTAENNSFGWQSFLGMKPGTQAVPNNAVPARVANLSGLPPAFIGVGSIDLFHDEDVDYAQRLNAADVPTELIVVPGAFHGFDLPMIKAPISLWFTAAKIDALRRGLGIAAK